MVDICLLGCGGGMPMTFRNLSSLLINYKGRKVLIDCGEGTQVAIREARGGFKSIDIICITHCHGDHIVGLPGLLATIGNSGREEKLTIVGPEGIKDVIKGLRVIVPYLPYELEIIENERELSYGVSKDNIFFHNDIKRSDIVIETTELDHSAPCIGYSFVFKRSPKFDVQKAIKLNIPKELWNKLQKEESVVIDGIEYDSSMVLGAERRGIKLSFVTDTRPNESIKEFICNSDLFVCEGTYGDDNDMDKAKKNKHMTFREAATLAKEGNCDELLLTHFSPAMESPKEYLKNAVEVFNNTIIGEDIMRKTINFKD